MTTRPRTQKQRDIVRKVKKLESRLANTGKARFAVQRDLERIHKAAVSSLTLNQTIRRYKTLLTNTWREEVQTALVWVINQLENFTGTPSIEELYFYENYLSTALGEPVAQAVRRPIVRLDEGSYIAGANEVARNVGFKFQLGLPDTRALAVLDDNILFWVGSYYDDFIQDDLRQRLAEYFQANLSRKELALRLRVDFRDYSKNGDAYWDLVADHTATKIREIGRVASYNQAEIKTVRIKAVLDSRTSAICRRLHGTVISVERLDKQVQRYLKAAGKRNKAAVKRSWPWWSDNDVERKLKTDRQVATQVKRGKIGLPPYHGRPFSEDTEVYTSDGWKNIKRVTGKEWFLSIDQENLDISWVTAIRKMVYNPEGRMVHFKSQNFDLLVAKNHDQVYSTKPWKKTKKWKLDRADSIKTIPRIYIPRCARWRGLKTDKVLIGNRSIPINIFVRFMAYWLSDGSVVKRFKNSYYITIANRKNQNKIYKDIQGITNNKIYKRETKTEFYDSDLGRYLMQFGKSFEKYIPNEILSLPTEKIKIFLEAYLLCDGSIVKTYGKYCKKGGYSLRKTFYTSSTRMAGELGECILKAGGFPVYQLQKQAGTRREMFGEIRNQNYDIWRIGWNVSKTATFGTQGKGKMRIVPYNGLAYCIELKKNHILWVRRNGKTCFSGNCRTRTVAEFEYVEFDRMLSDNDITNGAIEGV